MKKRLLSLLMAVAIGCSLLIAPAQAATFSNDNVALSMQALGVVDGTNWTSTVTRAQFAKMIMLVSDQRDNITDYGTGYSLYSDVKSDYWASAYIKLAVEAGYLSGYTDGSFRPDTAITWEQGTMAVLTLLGYSPSSLTGAYPYAQFSQATQIGLMNELSPVSGGSMTTANVAQMLYNLLEVNLGNGTYYGDTIDCPTINGEVDYPSLMSENLSGPYVWTSTSSLGFTPTSVYNNGTLTSSAVMDINDVYYYNANAKSVWIYTKAVSGTIDTISPNALSPTSVTVSGITYSLSTSTAITKLSYLSGTEEGDTVTLLLGLDGGVADVAEAQDGMYYGVVQSYTQSLSSDDTEVKTYVSVTCTDGYTYTFSVTGTKTYSTGAVVSIQTSSSGTTISSMSSKSISGKVNSSGTALGDYDFASNIQIMDTDDDGNAVEIDTDRIAGVTLNSANVRSYVLNSAGDISHLILKNATGDASPYGYMISADTNVSSSGTGLNSVSASYQYVEDGVTKTINLNGSMYATISNGGISITYDDGELDGFKQLTNVTLSSATTSSALVGSTQYDVADDVDVYMKIDDTYTLVSLSSVDDTDDYKLVGWYDNFGYPAGGQIRIIIATAK
ncbi:S-layer homology domain-containing protein [Bengtsoniella intestinalis]|uniref:S-layer homology domain-containing protein n=1 Tax=Bengtsoniella intestinalis TaxID=3073143 RepID=UPI00391F6E24